MTSSSPSAVIECPSLEVLVGFDLGELTDLEFETVASHLTGCQKCIAILAEWHSRPTDDRFEKQLRDCMIDPPASDPAQVETATQVPKADDGTISHPDKVEKFSRAPNLLVGRTVGRYEILKVLGSGGMGVVYLAKDPVMGRLVALKMISAESLHKQSRLARFGEESRVLAALRHPNVVQIYHFDEYLDLPYFTMEYVEGKTLQDFIPATKKEAKERGKQPEPKSPGVAERILSIRASAELMKTLALAVHAIHEMKVIHRDLKPANILIKTDGTPKIADFGLAKLLDSEAIGNLTQTGDVMGTTCYMSTEQAAGRVREIGPWSDVYSLGAVFYELLTGQPPYRGETNHETIQMVIADNPKSPRELRSDVPKLLEMICLKALSKKPKDRFENARSLADNLDDWLNGQHPRSLPGTVRQILQPTRRKAILVGLGAAATAIGAYKYRTNPDVIRRGIEADLRAGKAVTLIGEKGPPKWMKWVQGGNIAKIEQSRDGSFQIRAASGMALLELLPTTGIDSYVFSAQVRHDSAELRMGCNVGLYIARQSHHVGQVEANFLTILVFNDILGKTDGVLRFIDGVPIHTPDKNRLHLFQRMFTESESPERFDAGLREVLMPEFVPAGEGSDKWRPINITVSRESIVCEWESEKIVLSEKHIRKALSEYFEEMSSDERVPNCIRSMVPEFVPKGGLGIYVEYGEASFRSVNINPL